MSSRPRDCRAGSGIAVAAGRGRRLSAAEGGRLDRARFQVPHRRGHARAAPALHDGRRARPASRCWCCTARPARRASMLTPAFAGELFGPGQPLDAARYYIILPDAHRPRQIAQALRRPAQRNSRSYNYDDMVDAQYRLLKRGPRHQPPAPGDRQLDGRHADLAVGRRSIRTSWTRWCRWRRSRRRCRAATG